METKSLDSTLNGRYVNQPAFRRLGLTMLIDSKPTFNKGEIAKASIIQFATSQSVLIVQMKYLQNPAQSPTLKQLINSNDLIKVGVGIFDDLEKIKQDFGYSYQCYLDLGMAMGRCGDESPKARGLAALVEHFFGLRMSKSNAIRMGNWEMDRLSDGKCRRLNCLSICSCLLTERNAVVFSSS